MELRQVSISPPIMVDKRYELIYQPIVIDITIKPLGEIMDTHDDNVAVLYRWLDRSVQEVISKALASDPEVGAEVYIPGYTVTIQTLNIVFFRSLIGSDSFPGPMRLLQGVSLPQLHPLRRSFCH